MVTTGAVLSEPVGRHRGRRGLLIILGALVAAGLVPYRTIVAPVWRVEVVDSRGRPQARLRVSQTWTYYSLMSEMDYEQRLTDERGAVVFPIRSIRASAIHRAFGAVRELAHMGKHASFGPDAYIVLNVKRPGAPGAVSVGLREAAIGANGEVFHREVLVDETPHERFRAGQSWPPRLGHPPKSLADGDCAACHRAPAPSGDRGGPVPE